MSTSGARFERVGFQTASQAQTVASSRCEVLGGKQTAIRSPRPSNGTLLWGSHRLCEAEEHFHAQTELWAAAAQARFVSMAYLQADIYEKGNVYLLVTTPALKWQSLTSALPYALSKDSRHCSTRTCRV